MVVVESPGTVVLPPGRVVAGTVVLGVLTVVPPSTPASSSSWSTVDGARMSLPSGTKAIVYASRSFWKKISASPSVKICGSVSLASEALAQ